MDLNIVDHAAERSNAGARANEVREKMNGNSELPPANFYLCGWKAMIDEAKQRIQGLGYDRKAIHQELYG